MEVDGPPRMVGWITWSGRERSSQTQFLPVPGVRLIHPSEVYLSKTSCHLGYVCSLNGNLNRQLGIPCLILKNITKYFGKRCSALCSRNYSPVDSPYTSFEILFGYFWSIVWIDPFFWSDIYFGVHKLNFIESKRDLQIDLNNMQSSKDLPDHPNNQQNQNGSAIQNKPKVTLLSVSTFQC